MEPRLKTEISDNVWAIHCWLRDSLAQDRDQISTASDPVHKKTVCCEMPKFSIAIR